MIHTQRETSKGWPNPPTRLQVAPNRSQYASQYLSPVVGQKQQNFSTQSFFNTPAVERKALSPPISQYQYSLLGQKQRNQTTPFQNHRNSAPLGSIQTRSMNLNQILDKKRNQTDIFTLIEKAKQILTEASDHIQDDNDSVSNHSILPIPQPRKRQIRNEARSTETQNQKVSMKLSDSDFNDDDDYESTDVESNYDYNSTASFNPTQAAPALRQSRNTRQPIYSHQNQNFRARNLDTTDDTMPSEAASYAISEYSTYTQNYTDYESNYSQTPGNYTESVYSTAADSAYSQTASNYTGTDFTDYNDIGSTAGTFTNTESALYDTAYSENQSYTDYSRTNDGNSYYSQEATQNYYSEDEYNYYSDNEV